MADLTKILYVDDELLNLEVFRINLGNHFDVVVAKSGSEGLEMLHDNEDIELIVSDIKMPNMDGLEFIQKAKSAFPDKPCFILTGFEISSEIQQALDSKLITRYFQKPFDLGDLVSEFSSSLA